MKVVTNPTQIKYALDDGWLVTVDDDAGYEIVVHMPMENIGKTYGEEEYVLMSYFQENEIPGK